MHVHVFMIKYVLCRLHTSWYVIYVHGRYNVKRKEMGLCIIVFAKVHVHSTEL